MKRLTAWAGEEDAHMGGEAWHGVLDPRPGNIDVYTEHGRDSRALGSKNPHKARKASSSGDWSLGCQSPSSLGRGFMWRVEVTPEWGTEPVNLEEGACQEDRTAQRWEIGYILEAF